jgi:hypothetical protein
VGRFSSSIFLKIAAGAAGSNGLVQGRGRWCRKLVQVGVGDMCEGLTRFEEIKDMIKADR